MVVICARDPFAAVLRDAGAAEGHSVVWDAAGSPLSPAWLGIYTASLCNRSDKAQQLQVCILYLWQI